MAKSNRTSERPYSLDPFDDRVDTLFAELELAVKWGRPSILLAVYKSEFVRADIERLLNVQLAQIEIRVVHIIVNESQFDIPLELIKQSDIEKTVFFVSGLKWGGGRSGRNAYRALNIRREYLVDHKIRAIFWLTEEESAELPFRAPDFWAFRHRVVEFMDTPPVLYSARVDRPEPARSFFPVPEGINKKIEMQETLLQALSDGPGSTFERLALFFDLGTLYWLKGKLDKATETLSRATDLSRTTSLPDLQIRALIGLGILNSDLGLLSEAASAFERASRVDPQNFIPWLYLSAIYSKRMLSRRSLFAARKATQLNPRSAEAWLALGNLYAQKDNFPEAVASLQASLAIDRNNSHAWKSLGKIYLSAGDLAAALVAYEKSAKLNLEDGELAGKLALLYRDLGIMPKARKMARKAVKKAPRITQNWVTYGSVLAADGCLDDAIAAYSRVVANDPGNLVATISLASCFQKKGDDEQSSYWYSLAKKLPVENNNYTKAIFCTLANDYRTAIKFLKSALKRKQVTLDWLRQDPSFERMHSNTDFQRLLQK